MIIRVKLITGQYLQKEVEAFAKKLIRESGYKGYILGADCSIPNRIDDGRIRWISDIANKELNEK